MAALLLVAGYAATVPVVARFVPVVRERRWRWLLVHHAGVAAIVAGWALRGRPPAAAVNAAWLVASSAWYAAGGGVKSRSHNRRTADTKDTPA